MQKKTIDGRHTSHMHRLNFKKLNFKPISRDTGSDELVQCVSAGVMATELAPVSEPQFDSLVETLQNLTHSFYAWRSERNGWWEKKQASSLVGLLVKDT